MAAGSADSGGAEPARAPVAEPRDPPGSPARVWVSTTYFAEGFPYSIVNNLAEILFKDLGASLQAVGLTALLHLPWNLKFLWGPLLDRYETKRRWLVGCEVLLSLGLLVLTLLAGAGPSLAALAVCFFALAALSATHDIAIDGYYLEALDERGQSAYVGYRATAYKIAGILVGGPLLILAGGFSWRAGFLAAAAVMLALTVHHWIALPAVERRGLPVSDLARAAAHAPLLWIAGAVAGIAAAAVTAPSWLPGSWSGARSELVVAVGGRLGALGERLGGLPIVGQISLAGWVGILLLAALVSLLAFLPRLRARPGAETSPYLASFVDFLAQPRVGFILAFVVLFRAGESFLAKMRWPFLHDEVGMALETYGFANGTLGVAASFVATFAGGVLIARHGLRRWIWPFILAQNVLNLLYAWLAWLDVPSAAGTALVTGVIALEQFGSGLGTAVFMVYLMRCCDPSHRAAHMAIVTALMSVSFTLAGVASGFLAQTFGFAAYFAFTFVVSLPAMALVPLLPHLDERRAGPGSA